MVGKAGSGVDEAVEAHDWTMRSRSRSAAFACARMLRAQSRAASWPSVEIEFGAELAGDGNFAVHERKLTGNEELAVEVKKGDVAAERQLWPREERGRAPSAVLRSLLPYRLPSALTAPPKVLDHQAKLSVLQEARSSRPLSGVAVGAKKCVASAMGQGRGPKDLGESMVDLGQQLILALLAVPPLAGMLAGHAQAIAAKEPNKLVAHRAIYDDDARR